MYSNISQSLSAAQKADLQLKVKDMLAILVFLINLTPTERKNLLKMGDKSVRFVREVLIGLQANPSVIPPNYDVTEYEKDLTLYDDLMAILGYLRPLFEGIEDTILALGNELMREGISGYNLIKEAAKTTSALDGLAQDLGERFKLAGKTQPTVFTLAPHAQITLNGIVPERLFKTLSGATVSVYRGTAAAGTKKVVGGNSSVKLPSGWTTITVVNDDSALAGIFQTIQK